MLVIIYNLINIIKKKKFCFILYNISHKLISKKLQKRKISGRWYIFTIINVFSFSIFPNPRFYSSK